MGVPVSITIPARLPGQVCGRQAASQTSPLFRRTPPGNPSPRKPTPSGAPPPASAAPMITDDSLRFPRGNRP